MLMEAKISPLEDSDNGMECMMISHVDLKLVNRLVLLTSLR